MNVKKSFVAALVLALAAPVAFAAPMTAKDKADAQSIDSACTQEAQTAGCGDKVVGTGLLKCMQAYKKSHKEFKYSEGCKSAMKQLRSDRKAGK